ncbi:MAG: hypothetical protein KH972_02540 [Peptostreptococcaceae bacterium]|nr:hypothetical protein [Peptostreptococcaceae bacterium]
MSWSEAKWIVDNILQKTGRQPNNMRKLVAIPLSKTSIGLTFLEPSDSYDGENIICSVGGVMIRKSDEKYPTSLSDGELVIDNKELGKYSTDNLVVDGLIEGKPYYFSAFPYSTQGVYNLSPNEANHTTAKPADGESVTITINIDDTSAFGTVTIKCVDETESSKTQSVQLSASKRTATFTVTTGHRYHIEYGEMAGYSKPSNTSPKISVAGTTTSVSGNYNYFTSTIKVTYPVGATVKCINGDTTYTAPNTSGNHTFSVHKSGTWTITATKGIDSTSTTVQITASGQSKTAELSFVKIYGISRVVSSSSPNWSRTDDAVGKTATPSVGTQAGHSDFNNCYPWSQMVRQTLSTGDVMVKIPEFWFKRYVQGGTEYIKIADKQTEGFVKHPGSGRFVGAYKTSSNNKSVRNASPTVNQTRATMRNNAKNKGTGWGIIDLVTESAIQILFLVEFATNNSQAAIGRGYCDNNSSALSSGTCDNVSGLTGRPAGTDGKVDVVYRGIEGIWGNIYEWVDGINVKDGEYYICLDQSRYADDTSSNYHKLGYRGLTNNSWITAEGMDNNYSWAMLPTAGSGGSESTYYADYVYDSTGGWRGGCRSGFWNSGSVCGLFLALLYYSSSITYSYFGSRLLYKPS